MGNITFTLSVAESESELFDLRGPGDEVADYVSDVVGPLVEALANVYSPATLAVILDIAAKSAAYSAAEEAPHVAAAQALQGIMWYQREKLRTAGREVYARPLTAEMLW